MRGVKRSEMHNAEGLYILLDGSILLCVVFLCDSSVAVCGKSNERDNRDDD